MRSIRTAPPRSPPCARAARPARGRARHRRRAASRTGRAGRPRSIRTSSSCPATSSLTTLTRPAAADLEGRARRGEPMPSLAEARRWHAAGRRTHRRSTPRTRRCSAARASAADRSLAAADRAARCRSCSPVACGQRTSLRRVRDVPAIGVDVASGVEIAGTKPPRKDPLAVALFVKRARAARFDLPNHRRPAAAGRTPALLEADAHGRWGTRRDFGGRYVPETLMSALLELERTYFARARRPDVLGRAARARHATSPAGPRRSIAPTGSRDALGLDVRIYLKREDLAHTGAHKINNVLGQGLLAQAAGQDPADRRDRRRPARRRHGHGRRAARAAVRRVHGRARHRAPAAERAAHAHARRRGPLGRVGSATLKDAINEAMRDWVTNVADTYYVLGSAMGPHPYPTIVRDFQRVIGDEAAAQIDQAEGRLPDLVVACVGGGSNAIGLFSRFIGEPTVRLVAVEAAGDGIETGHHAAALAAGSLGIIHGARTMLLQDADGQVQEAHSISAGLDYPGVGPQLAALAPEGRLELGDVDRHPGTRRACGSLARSEGILPALEPAHALAALPRDPRASARRARSSCVGLVRPRRQGHRPPGGTGVTRDTVGSQRIGQAFAARQAAGRIAFVPVRRRRLPGRRDVGSARHGRPRRRRRHARDRPALFGSAGGRRHAPAREHGRARRGATLDAVVRHGRARGPSTAGQAGRSSWATPTSSWGRAVPSSRRRAAGRCRRRGRDRGRPARPTRASRSRQHSTDHGLALVYLVAPTSSAERIELIGKRSGGFVYCVSLTGVTGARRRGPATAGRAGVARQRAVSTAARRRGFRRVAAGARSAPWRRAGADGVIVGSALVDALGADGRDVASLQRAVRSRLAGSPLHGSAWPP